MLRILLAEAELELAPPEVAGHPAVRKHAQSLGKKPTQTLLDQNVHRAAILQLPDGERRGRPDIVQYSLLTLLESPLCKAGGLEAAVHARNGELLRIRPDTRLPRGESRFQGLVSKVLAEGRSQDKDPLVWVEGRMEPAQALAAFARGPVLRLDEHGTTGSPEDVVQRAVGGDLTLVLGAYPSGGWSPAWRAAVPEAVSVWPEPLNAWAVAAEVASAFRRAWLPAPQRA